MSCRTLVVALVLLVSSPTFAQSPDADGGASDGGLDVTVPAIDVPDAGLDAIGPDLRQPRPALESVEPLVAVSRETPY